MGAVLLAFAVALFLTGCGACHPDLGRGQGGPQCLPGILLGAAQNTTTGEHDG